MRPWYIGESRAQNLLVYAQGVLAKYAYQLPYQGYLEVWNALQSTIPLWVEERRGPRNAQTGQPLSLESDYKKYIDWWVYQLVAVRTGKESKVKASFVNKVFSKDPAGAVFGTRVAASRLQAAVEDDMAGQLDAMFRAIMDDPTQVSSSTVYDLLVYGLDTLNKLIAYYGPTNAEALRPLRTVLTQWMSNLFQSWITASTELGGPGEGGYHIGGVPGKAGSTLDPNWANQWKYPTTGTPLFGVEGDKITTVHNKLDEVLNYAVRQYASGATVDTSGLTPWGAKTPSLGELKALDPAFNPLNLTIPTGFPTPGVAGADAAYQPSPDKPTPAGELINPYDLENKAMAVLQLAGLGRPDAAKKVELFVAAFAGNGKVYLTGIAGKLAAGEEAKLQADVKAAFKSATGYEWSPFIGITTY
jgi:hypothetical protein